MNIKLFIKLQLQTLIVVEIAKLYKYKYNIAFSQTLLLGLARNHSGSNCED